MTRRIMLELAALRKNSIWDTPQGQYVLQLRNELEKLGYFDDLKEDWDEVERALSEGCKYFEIRPSRIEGRSKLLFRVAPIKVTAIKDVVLMGQWRGLSQSP